MGQGLTGLDDEITIDGRKTTLRDEGRKRNLTIYAYAGGSHQYEWGVTIKDRNDAHARFQVSEEDYKRLGGPPRHI